MRDPEIREEDDQTTVETPSEKIRRAIERLVALVPASDEPQSPERTARAKEIVRAASLKAAAVSGALTLPLGPLGLLTILPDLMAIWHIQRKMVADIAAILGRTAQLGPKQMLYCLFKHTTSRAFRKSVISCLAHSVTAIPSNHRSLAGSGGRNNFMRTYEMVY